jgi:glycosyltransferase involved in cell wall biosynthesis
MMVETMLPWVTIVTPSYNQGDFLAATIRSVLEQDYSNIEYLVYDGGSTDNSLEIIQHYAERLDYWESKPDQGQAQAINKGLKRSKGQILGWLNSDDVLLPDAVSEAVKIFRREQDVDVVYGRLKRIDRNGKIVPTPTLPKDIVEFNKYNVIGECVVNQPGSFWRRDILDRVGYLNEDLDYAFDYEYWVRILLAGGGFKRLNRPVAAFRLSPNSKTVGQTARAALEHLKIIEAFSSRSDLPEKLGISKNVIEKQARKGSALIKMYIFYGFMKEKRWIEAFRWFALAHVSDPLILFNRRWLDLALSRLQR